MHGKISVNEQTSEVMATVPKGLEDLNRLHVFEALMCGNSCNGWLTEEAGLSANLLPHHPKFLCEAELVQDRRDAMEGRWIYYQVDLSILATLYQWLVYSFDPTRVTLQPPRCDPEGILPSSSDPTPQSTPEETTV